MAQRISRVALWVAAAALVIFGLFSFALPQAASEQFPWRVGPFLAMTIGGWAIGMAAMAAVTALTWRVERVLPGLATLWVFGIGEIVVALAFLDKLVITSLTIPYLTGLVALVTSAVCGLAWLASERPSLRGIARPAPIHLRLAAVGFIALVGALAFLTAFAPQGGATTEGRVFPEPMTLFSARAFAAFFASLAAGGLVLLVASTTVAAYRFYSIVGLMLIAPITLAASMNIGRFDFSGQPGHAAYLGAYMVVGLGALVLLLFHPREREMDTAQASRAAE